ncbi:MAG: MBL fold metallo-hydrolase [Oligoflexales bacterium]
MSQMKLKFLGVRGSRPTHKSDLLGFGGNSTSMEFLLPDENFCVLLDGGSGIAHRAKSADANKSRYYFLITHTHWDHILGFPFFKPLYNENNEVTFFASKTSKANFNDLFFGIHRLDNLPVPLEALKAKQTFKSIKAGSSFVIEEKVKVNTYQINHQGITLAYRLTYKNDSVAVVTDNAPIEDGNYMGENMQEKAKDDPKKFEKEFNQGLVSFLKDCNTVVIDTHFTEENLKPDWGHSTPQRALKFCIDANVKRLILFHHAPEDLDHMVQAKVASVIDEAKEHGIEVVPAKEGEEWVLHCD